MKMNMILGKKQIILASLVVILGIAVYLNWQFAKTGEDFAVTGTLSNESSNKNMGDAQLVNNQESTDYFSKAKIEKQKSRDKSIETVQTMLKDTNLTQEEKEVATKGAEDIAKNIEAESAMENLIKAKGFQDCIVYVDNQKANVVVKTEGLISEQAAQIKDIVLAQAAVDVENITITEVK